MIEIGRRVVEAVGNGAIHVYEGNLLSDGICGMAPEQYGWIPKIGGRIGVVQVFEKISADNPVLGGVSADSVEVTNSGPVIRRWTACVLKPAILHHAIVDSDAVGHIRRIGFDEL